MRKAVLTLAIVLAAASAPAQDGFERFGLDTTGAIDFFHGDNVSDRPQIIVDVVATVRLGNGWQAYFRPWFRLARPFTPTGAPPPWDAQIYQASLRYEHSGPVSTRVDLGYMPSPIGLGIFDVNPRQNPTIAGHSSYFSPLPPFDTNAVRVPAIAATYPLAALVTLSGAHWDARAGITDSAPVRISVPFVSTNPHATPVFEAGAGVTPIIGLRVGGVFAKGTYIKNSELVPGLVPGDRELTLAGFEGEYAWRYTKISGEAVHDTFSIPAGEFAATEWFIQATQTVAPRWTVAGRHEGTSMLLSGTPQHLYANELTVGFRATRDLTLKSGLYVRQPYGRTDWDRQAAVQAVFQHRWW
jgi:hypothetical protein